MRIQSTPALCLLLALPLAADTSSWRIDSAHSAAQFAVRHMMLSTVRGQFASTKGTAQIDDRDATKSSIEVTIDTRSIDTREPKRDAHLKSADFFDAEKFPSLTFKSKRIEKTGEGRLRLIGDLTIKDVTREVALDVDGPSAPLKDARGGQRIGASATAKINRKDFGLTWNRALEAGGVMVGDEVTITIDAELVKEK